MATAYSRRRGTTLQHASFAGLVAELTVDTDKDTVVVHDGATSGGFPLAREDLSNVSGAVIVTFLSGATLNAVSISGATISASSFNGGNISATTISASTFNAGTISGSTLSAVTVNGSTISGATVNASTISGGTISAVTINGSNISGSTISGATFNGGTISGSAISGATIENSAIGAVSASTVRGTTITALSAVICGDYAAQTINGASAWAIQALGTGLVVPIPGYTAIRYSNAANNAHIVLGKSRGTTVGSHTVVQSGDGLGQVSWHGSDGTAFIPAAIISAVVDGTPGTNDMPTRLNIGVTADGAAAVTTRLSIRQDGTGEYTGVWRPGANNTYTLGDASFRWSEVFATNGTINTSDETEKQNLSDIDDALLDAWADVSWRLYKWKSAVASKGSSARYHAGLIAQEVRDVLLSADIDGTSYGLLCRDDVVKPIMGEVTDTEGRTSTGVVGYESDGERWGLRYAECMVVEAAWCRRELLRLHARVSALEGA